MTIVTCPECGTTEALAGTDLSDLPEEQWSWITHGTCDECFMYTFGCGI